MDFSRNKPCVGHFLGNSTYFIAKSEVNSIKIFEITSDTTTSFYGKIDLPTKDDITQLFVYYEDNKEYLGFITTSKPTKDYKYTESVGVWDPQNGVQLVATQADFDGFKVSSSAKSPNYLVIFNFSNLEISVFYRKRLVCTHKSNCVSISLNWASGSVLVVSDDNGGQVEFLNVENGEVMSTISSLRQLLAGNANSPSDETIPANKDLNSNISLPIHESNVYTILEVMILSDHDALVVTIDRVFVLNISEPQARVLKSISTELISCAWQLEARGASHEVYIYTDTLHIKYDGTQLRTIKGNTTPLACLGHNLFLIPSTNESTSANLCELHVDSGNLVTDIVLRSAALKEL